MDGRLVYGVQLVRTAGSIYGVCRSRDERRLGLRVLADQGHILAVRSELEVEQEVGTDTVDPARVDALGLLRLVLEDNCGDMDGVRVQLGAGRNGVVPWLETRDGGDDDIEWNLPCRSVLGGGGSGEIVSGGVLQNLAELHAAVGDDVLVVIFVGVKLLQDSLCLGGGRELGQNAEDLSAGKSADVDVVAENGAVGSRDGEGDLGQSRVERLDVDHRIALLVKTQCAEQTLNFDVRVERPDTDVITVLIGDARTLRAELDVDAVPVCIALEKFAGKSNGCGIRVLRIVNALGPGECTGRKLA